MSQMQIDQVLSQIRALNSAGSSAVRPANHGATTGVPAFGDLLKKSLDAVNETQTTAGKLAEAYELGTGNVDLATVMIESQKASVSFRALTEVRNRLVNVYQDIMNMPV
jgi:flagellar hook-basal body complex protein FliE